MTGNLTTTTLVDLHESQAPTLGTVIVLGAVLSVIVVALRFYTRIVIVGKVFHNDYCILAALVRDGRPPAENNHQLAQTC